MKNEEFTEEEIQEIDDLLYEAITENSYSEYHDSDLNDIIAKLLEKYPVQSQSDSQD